MRATPAKIKKSLCAKKTGRNKKRKGDKFKQKSYDYLSQRLSRETLIKRVVNLLGEVCVEELEECESDMNMFQDLDLIILGSPPEEYNKYVQLLRKEYCHLEDISYKNMRLKSGRSISHLKSMKRKIAEGPSNIQRNNKEIKKSISVTEKNNSKITRNENNLSKVQIKSMNDVNYSLTSKNQVIIIDDDESEGNGLSPAIKINDSDVEIINIVATSPIESVKTVNNGSLSCVKSVQNNGVFYTDLTTGFNEKEIPIYGATSSASTTQISKSSEEDEVICIDSSPIQRKIPKGDGSLDNSVIFVWEHQDLKLQSNEKLQKANSSEFIPFTQNNTKVYSKRKITGSAFKKSKKLLSGQNINILKEKKADNLFTASEQKIIQEYNTNTYNPHKEIQKSPKRMIIVDGSNIAFGHSLNKEFSVKGLEICLNYFEKMGHEVKAVVPQFRLHKCSEPDRMEKLHQEGKIVLTPCKNLPGKSVSSYDDRFILQLATEFDAAIVSNDNFRDLINENPAFKKIIENRVIGYTWCNDMFILPKDPYGRAGPRLSVIMNRA